MRVFRDLEELPKFENAIITIGSFDGVNSGHQRIIQRLNILADEFNSESVVISFYPHPRSVIYPKDKSLKLLSSMEEKIALFESLDVDNLVIVPFTIEFSQQSAQEYLEKFLIEKFNPKYIVIGYDHRFGMNRAGNLDMLMQQKDKFGYDVIQIPKQEIDEITISSTKIRNALLDGDLSTANTLLNHPYELSGKVIRGRKLGTEIGFPTANLDVEEKSKLIPKDGIYACEVKVGESSHNGMLYIGDIPTIGTDNPKSIEVNIFDFNDDIYDQRINIKILEFLREEKKFNGINELKQQLIKDRDAALSFFNRMESNVDVKATIAILNYNTRHLIEMFMPSVTYSAQEQAKVLLIDNGSDDDSIQYVNEWFPEVETMQLLQNYGFAEAYNKAAESIDTPYMVLLNSDVEVTENWLDPLIEFLESNKEYAAVMPKIRSYENRDSFEYAGASGGYLDVLSYPFCRGRIFDKVEGDESQYEDTTDIAWTTGAAMVIRTDVFRNLGGFDGDYFAHQEEIDLCWRIRNAGYKLAVVPQSVVYHLGGGTLDYSNAHKVYLNFRNNLSTLLKNESLIHVFWKIPLRLILDGIAGVKFLFSGEAKGTLAIVKAHFGFYARIFKLFSKRLANKKLVRKYRVAKPNKSGVHLKPILLSYYLMGKKKFSQL